jgi:hypothetical protein
MKLRISLVSVAVAGTLICLSIVSAQGAGQGAFPGIDKLPSVKELPDPFLMNNGKRVSNAAEWLKRREELKAMILYYEYGHPAPAAPVSGEVLATKKLESGATEKEIRITTGPNGKVAYKLILTIPDGKGKRPVIVKGDLCWGRVAPAMVVAAVRRGYVVAEFDRTEIAPDNADRTKGAHPLYPDYDWSTTAAWAWGFHRTVDYLLAQPLIDKTRIAITGHSRGGKAALLAGALDERIALTAPNGSGCGGAGCYRVQGPKSEDIGAILKRFGYWFHPRFNDFVEHVNQIPFDQHSVRALVAPRALLSTEALGDLWANPSGTQASYLAGLEVFKFLKAADKTGIHFREGKHEQNSEDWQALLDFADKQFYKKSITARFDRLAFPDMPRGFSWTAPKK